MEETNKVLDNHSRGNVHKALEVLRAAEEETGADLIDAIEVLERILNK